MALAAKPEEGKYKEFYVGKLEGHHSWLVRATMNIQIPNLQIVDSAQNSLFLKKELVFSVVEFDHGKNLIHIAPTDLLIVNYWQVTLRVEDPDSGNF